MNIDLIIALIGNYMVLQIVYVNVMKCKRIGIINRIAFIISILVGFIAVPVLAPIIRTLIHSTGLYDVLVNGVGIILSNGSYNMLSAYSGSQDIPKWMLTVFEQLGSSSSITASTYVVKIIIRILVFVISIAIVRVVFMLFFDVTKIVSKMPVIEQFDHILGAAYGVIEVIFILWIVMFAGFFLLGSKFAVVNENIDKIYLLKMMYTYNPLMIFIKK